MYVLCRANNTLTESPAEALGFPQPKKGMSSLRH